MQGIRFEHLSDDTEIKAIGSLFRRINGSQWGINLGFYPFQPKSSLTVSNAPVLVRRRILNPTSGYKQAGYRQVFTVTDTSNWKVDTVSNCPVLENPHSIEKDHSVTQNNLNTGAISGARKVGGITGISQDGSHSHGNINTGVIRGRNIAAGVTGWGDYNTETYDNLSTGSVTVTDNWIGDTGGIVGYVKYHRTHRNLNVGMIHGTHQVGGVVGKADDYSDSYDNMNTGMVVGTYGVGGIVGYASGDAFSAAHKTYDNLNIGTIKGGRRIGGIVGYVYKPTT